MHGQTSSNWSLVAVAVISATSAGIICHGAEPGAAHQAAMEKARRRAGIARSAIEREIPGVKGVPQAFTRLQQQYSQLTAEKKILEAKFRKALETSSEYRAIATRKSRLDADRRAARKAGNHGNAKALGKASYKCYQETQRLKKRLMPEESRRAKQVNSSLSLLRRRLVSTAVRELQNHPQLKKQIAAYRQAVRDEERHLAALYKARGLVTPLEYLAAQKPPKFKKGHTLPPLSRFGWNQPFEQRKMFADNWGYAVELNGYVTSKTLALIEDPDSDEARSIALVKSDPKKYKLSVICNRYWPDKPPAGTWSRDAKGNLLSATAKSYDGNLWHPGMKTVVSPLAPDALWVECGRGRAESLAAVRKMVPIAIVLNGGEYGLGVWGFAGKVWKQDPAITKAIEARGGDWFDFLSERKARAEMLIADAVRKAVPDRELYIYYTTSGCPHRGRYGGWSRWAYDYKHMKPVSDLASVELYANHFNSGWTGKMDILSMALNSTGRQLALGQPLAYSWFWCKKKDEDMRSYMGFLKCVYLMGTLGGNAGAYHYPDFKSGFKPDSAPYWMKQMIALGRVHAFYSHLEDYIRNGELVPGDCRHVWSLEQPAYELVPEELKALERDKDKTPFIYKSIASGKAIAKPAAWPGGSKDVARALKLGRGVRVLARRHKTRPECLVAAWAADGQDCDVTVNVPGFGIVKLRARRCGSVYLVTAKAGTVTARLLDTDAECPSRSFR